MTWLTWRQLRAQAAAVVVVVSACALGLLVTGQRLHDLAVPTAQVYDLLRPGDRTLWTAGIVVMAAVPALVGMFWGAPLVARELESGTHRLVWNQGVTRARWFATKLGLTAAVVAVLVGILSGLVTWWAAPLDGTTSRTQGGLSGRLTPIAFAMRGVVPVGYAVFALVLGAAIGLVVRRTLAAMAITLLLLVVVQVAMPLWGRPHLTRSVHEVVALTARPLDSVTLDHPGGPVSITLAGGRGDWVLVNRTVDAAGRPAALPSWFATCADGGGSGSGTTDSGPGSTGPARVDGASCLGRLAAEGYHQEMVVVPASRFWSVQAAECAVFLIAAGVLALGCLWWLRRRVG